MTEEQQIASLVTELVRTIQKVGYKKVMAKINELNGHEKFTQYQKEVSEYIIKIASEKYNTNPEELRHKHLTGNKVHARAMCFVQIKKHLGIPHIDIASMFGKDNHAFVSHAIRDFNAKNPDLPADKEFIDNFKEIDKKIIQFKAICWEKHN